MAADVAVQVTNIVAIQKSFAPDNIVAGLRKLADQIEDGEYGLRTTCLVVLGHTDDRIDADGDKRHSSDFELFGYGPRCDTFTTRGLLLTAATQL
jgi:hypothetical protein